MTASQAAGPGGPASSELYMVESTSRRYGTFLTKVEMVGGGMVEGGRLREVRREWRRVVKVERSWWLQ